MVRARPSLPAGHGELLVRPSYDEWAGLLTQNREAAQEWSFEVCGMSAPELRALAREELLLGAESFSTRLGVAVDPTGPPDGPIVMTGHQPELYHPGVWVKDFLLQRISDEVGATAVDVVVDSDGYDTIALTSPCLSPTVRRCRQYLSIASDSTCYACSPVPSSRDIDLFCEAGDTQLSTLPAPSIRRHFAEFCTALRSAALDSQNVGELVTFARRRYEATAGTRYLEAPVTAIARTRAFASFVADMALESRRFAEAYNDELHAFRAFTKTRSQAQPFPNLAVNGDEVELPLWALSGGRRETLWASKSPAGVRLTAGGRTIAELPSEAFGEGSAAGAVLGAGSVIAPKALALTLFLRLFCSDLFIHGVGGGRYDRVTDGVCRRYYGVEPPGFVVASLTMYLPLGVHVVTDDEVSSARERLNRLEHNPNQVLDEVEFDSNEERRAAHELAREKGALVELISEPDADKKELGIRIRAVNQALSDLLQPLHEEWSRELASMESQREASEVFVDRGYPFCLWSPAEVADKVW